MSLIIPLLAIVVLACVAIRWRRLLVMSLPFLVVLAGVPLPFGGVSVRLDQLAACLLLIPLVASILVGQRRLRLDVTSWLVIALLAVNVAASVVNSPVPRYSLTQCVNLAATWVIYILLINLLDELEQLETFLRCVVWAAALASAIAIGAFVLEVLGVHVGGAEVSTSAAENLTRAYGAYGTMLEPNILGSFAAANLLLATVLSLSATRTSLNTNAHRKLLRWTIALTATALVLSFTRAAWLGAAVGLFLVFVLSARTLKLNVRVGQIGVGVAVLVAAVVVLLTIPGDIGTLLRFKLLNIVNPASQTAFMRLFAYTLAIQQTATHPILGWGTFSFAALTVQGADFQQFENWRNLWLGNYLLLALHDTGILGLALLVAILVSIIRRALRVLHGLTPADELYASRIIGLLAALASMLVAFLATSGFSLGYSWLTLGLIGAYCRVLEERSA